MEFTCQHAVQVCAIFPGQIDEALVNQVFRKLVCQSLMSVFFVDVDSIGIIGGVINYFFVVRFGICTPLSR
ncbi:Uncharacterised protein [Raoultella terrigena]|uniref:Uncharacterized protein n=1 Tax=Raoultella terrigena TaxID=577 RepID=A0A4U9DAY7_RAOTE|nr:Uncharacterised protein [Raoultella terrigena]